MTVAETSNVVFVATEVLLLGCPARKSQSNLKDRRRANVVLEFE